MKALKNCSEADCKVQSRKKKQIENQLKKRGEKKLTKILPILSATEFFRRGWTSVLNNSIEIGYGYLVTVQLLKKNLFRRV